MPAPPLIAFLSDYGTADPYVGLCHAVVVAAAPQVRVVDVVHDIDAYDVAQGALLLRDCLPFLPAAVLLAVVDPGVGSGRRALVLRAGQRWLVGPDNGLLLPAAERLGGVEGAWALPGQPSGPARTFDGRDVFAPAAARLAAGQPAGALGTAIAPGSLVPPDLPATRVEGGELHVSAIRRDRFGNLLLSALREDLDVLGWEQGLAGEVEAPAGRLPFSLATTFSDVAPGALALLPDAFGRLQLAVREGDASARAGGGAGVALVLRRLPRR